MEGRKEGGEGEKKEKKKAESRERVPLITFT